MVNSFDANWPENVDLIIYLENSHLLSVQKKSKRLIIKDFHEEIPEYKIFCKKYVVENYLQVIVCFFNKFLHNI